MQTHQSQNRLARLIEQELTRINQQQQTNPPSQCQELLDKTTDLMNAVGESFFRCIDHHISFFFLLLLCSQLRIHHERKPISLVNYKCYH